ncbi:MAG: hypothetical protein Q8M07_17845 [Prosthecobacter sp.]|nr:hypothetical protein [Prosthecobacter sp.]
MPSLKADLQRLDERAYSSRHGSEEALRAFHRVAKKLRGVDGDRLWKLHEWILVPITLWPFEVCDVMLEALDEWKKHVALGERLRLLIDLLPDPPDEAACEIVARHEHQVQSGDYEHVLGNEAKYAQKEAELKTDPGFQEQWARIKAAFDLSTYADHKGVIRRTMGTERNLRPEWPNRLSGPEAAFQTAFDAFCMNWNLYGMLHDEPLLLKLAVNLTPYATMIVIPAYWSLDPKRDVRWGEIARLHRARARQRQGAALKEGKEHRRRLTLKLGELDAEAKRRGLRGEARHAFLCEGLGWVPETSAKRLSRLRTEFKK